MNVMQMVGMVTTFMQNPEKAVRDLQEKMIIPGWEALEKNEGGNIRIVIDRQGDEIGIHLYRMVGEQNLNFVASYSLLELIQLLKNKATPDGNERATIAAPQPITGTTDPGTGETADEFGRKPCTNTGHGEY